MREANYLVSRVHDDATAYSLTGCEHVDGIVVDLPPLAAASFTRRLASAARRVPTIVVSGAHADRGEVVTYVDLMLARFN